MKWEPPTASTTSILLARFGRDIKIVHFLGADKPWLGGGGGAGAAGHRALWWDIYSTEVGS